MLKWLQNTLIRRGLLALCVIFAALALGGSWLKSPLEGDSGIHGIFETVLPAKVEAGAQFDVVSEYSGRVKSVHVANGSQVSAGQVLVTLENTEISASVTSAVRRLTMATSRSQALTARQRAQLEKERLAARVRAQQAAQERLNSYSLDQTQSALADAKRRATEIQVLVKQGLASSSELETAQLQEQTAIQNLQAAREHLSRLQQEVEDADSQMRLARLQPVTTGSSVADAEHEIEEAQASVDIARERESHLTLTAPGPGTVMEFSLRPGQWIHAGSRLIRIADSSTLVLSAPVTAAIVQKVSPGDAVHVRLPTEPPRRLAAHVTTIDLTPDASQGAYVLRVRLPNQSPGVMLVGLEGAIELPHGGRP